MGAHTNVVNFLLLGGLLPMVLAGVIALATRRLGRRLGPEVGGGVGYTLGLGLGWIASHLAVRGLPPLPPLDVMDWLPFLAVAATTVGLSRLTWPNLRARLSTGAALVAGLLALILQPMAVNTWSPRESIVQFAVSGFLIVAAWLNLAALSRRLPAWILTLSLLFTALTLSLIQAAFSSGLVLGQLGLGFAGSIAGLAVAASLVPLDRLGAGAVAVVVIALSGFCLIGQVYGNLAVLPAILILAAPAGAWVGLLIPARRPVQFVLGLLGTATLLTAALGLAYQAAPVEESSGYEGFGKVDPPMGQRIVQVDAFTTRAFGGNPAAVCVGKNPSSDRWMQRVAAEMNLSETAFLHPEGEPGTYHLRWFTPTVEVDLCGHATLASAHVLWEDGHLAADQPARFLTRGGTLEAERRDAWIALDFPAIPAHVQEPPDGLIDAIGARPTWVGRAGDDWLVEVESAEVVRQLSPDQAGLKAIPARGFLVTAIGDGQQCDFVSRFFAPACGIPEDPVTGSAHCALASYWSTRLGKTRLTGHQISARGGVVRVELRGDRVILEGQAVTVFAGDLSEAAMNDT